MARPLTIADTGANLRTFILSEAWAAINAEGGTPARGDDYARGFNDAICKALDILEALGARNPATAIPQRFERAA